MSDDRLSGIEMTLGVLVSGQARIETRLDGLETRLDKVEIAQEQTADHVKQIAEGHAALIAAIQRSAREVCDHFDERILPLEAAIRELP